MDNISSELKRINSTLLIMMVIILLGSCAGGNVTVDYPEDINSEGNQDMVDLGNGHFGVYRGTPYDELKIYYYDQEKNELVLKTTESIEDYSEE